MMRRPTTRVAGNFLEISGVFVDEEER